MTLRVGLTGGIGSGKSVVAEIWRERGATIIDADVLSREVVAPGTDGLRAIGSRWPQAIANGALDRAVLARIVFEDDDERSRLNNIVHPRVRALAERMEADAPAEAIAVHVVPLLFESDWWRTCDATVLVVAPDATRVERVIERDGIDPASIARRMRAQIDPTRARELATYAIDNDGGIARLRERADRIYDALTELR